jgi:hypothetical protein
MTFIQNSARATPNWQNHRSKIPSSCSFERHSKTKGRSMYKNPARTLQTRKFIEADRDDFHGQLAPIMNMPVGIERLELRVKPRQIDAKRIS